MSADSISRKELYEQWKREESTDLLVVVGGKEFKCHATVLCACSDFFQAMIKYKMKETQGRVVRLGNLKAETFSTILESLYTEKTKLTDKNVLDMWYASHQLQIKLLMEECEKFLTEKHLSVDTCVPLYFHATKHAAKTTLNVALTYICKNFKQLKKTNSYLSLTSDDIFTIANNSKLTVTSEDSVIEFILKWVCHTPQDDSHTNQGQDELVAAGKHAFDKSDRAAGGHGEEESKTQTMTEKRQEASNMSKDAVSDTQDTSCTDCSQTENVAEKVDGGNQQDGAKQDIAVTSAVSRPKEYPRAEHLLKLLRAARLCLASKDALENLLQDELVVGQKEAHAYVFEALMYKLDVGRRHGSWPKAAIHRNPGHHSMVFVETKSNDIMAYSLDYGDVRKWDAIQINEKTIQDITVFDNQLLLYNNNEMMLLPSEWTKKETKVNDEYYSRKEPNFGCFLAHEDYVYLQYKNIKVVDYDFVRKTHTKDDYKIECMGMITFPVDNPQSEQLSYDSKEIICSAVPFKQYIITFKSKRIDAIDTKSSAHLRLGSIPGPMKNIISFNDQRNTFILQRNGKMWKILLTDSAEKLKLEPVAELWNFDWAIYGGIFYKGKLFIFGDAHGAQNDWQTRQTSLPGLFKSILYVFIRSRTRCVPIVI